MRSLSYKTARGIVIRELRRPIDDFMERINRRRSFVYIALPVLTISVMSFWLDRQFGNLVLEYYMKSNNIWMSIGPSSVSERYVDGITSYTDDVAAMGLKILSNTLVVYVANILLIIVSGLSIFKFISIIVSYEYRKAMILASAVIWVAYFVYNTNVAWTVTGDYATEAHFREITLDLQTDIISTFNSIPVPVTDQEKENFPFNYDTACVNKFCIHSVGIVRGVYWISLMLIIMVAATGVMAGAATLSPFEYDSGQSASVLTGRKIPAKMERSAGIQRDILEYRKRVNDVRVVLYYGSACLAVAVIWISAQARWAAGALVEKVAGIGQIVSSVTLYLTLLYIAILALSYLPPAMWLYARLRQKYFTEIKSNEETEIVGFDKWVEARGIDVSVITTKDIIAILAPLGSLVISNNLDYATLSKFIGV